MSRRDFAVTLLINAVDQASKNIESVNSRVRSLREELERSEFSRSSDGLARFGAAAKAASQPLADAAKQTLALGAAITALTAAMAGKVYRAAVDYESSIMDLAKVLDGGRQEAEKYGAQLDKLAIQYGQNGQALLASMTNFVQAGYTAKESFDLVEQSIRMMIAGEVGADEASSDLVSILKGFNAPATDAAHAVDALNEVSNKYATDVRQLATGMAGLSPVAAQMGFTLDETAALLTPVIEVYRSGSEAADALKVGLLKLTDNTKTVTDALTALGVSQTDANGQMRSGKDIFLDVARAMQGMDDATRSYYTQQLVGIEQSGRMSTVFRDLGKYFEITAVAAKSSGSAMREVQTRLQTAQAQIDRTNESFRQLSVTLGNQFKVELSGVIGATGELAAAFDRATKSGSLEPLFAALRPQIQAIDDLLSAMAKNLEAALAGVDWTPLVAGLREFSGEFADAFSTLTEGVDLTTVEGLRKLIQGIVNVLGDFSRFLAGAVDGLGPFLDSLNILGGWIASEGHPQLAQFAGELEGLALSFNTLVPILSSFASKIFGAAGAVVEFTVKIALLATGLRVLSALGVPVLALLGGLVSRFLALSPAVAGLVSALAGLPGAIVALGAAAGAAGYGLGTMANKAWEMILGGRTLGTAIYDLVHWNDQLEQSITKAVSAEELAAATARRLAREEEAKAEAFRQASAAAAGMLAYTNTIIDRAEQEQAVTEALTAAFKTQGQEYDTRTGRLKSATAASGAAAAATAWENQLARDGIQVLQWRNDALTRMSGASGAAATQTTRLAEAISKASQDDANGYANKLALIRARSVEIVTLANAEAAKRLTTARALGQDTKQIEEEIAATKKANLSRIEREYQAHIDRLNAEARRHLDAVRSIEDQIASLKKSSEDKIRAILQTGMTDYEKYQDQQKQIAEKGIAAREALLKGEFETASKLYQEQADLAANSARQVTDGDKTVLTAKDAAKKAAEQYKTAIENATQALESQKESEKARAEAAKQAAEDAQGALNALDGKDTKSEHTVTSNADQVLADLDKLQGHDTSSTHTIYEKTVSTNNAGGLVGVLRRASGGSVFPLLSGSTVPGAGDSDSVRAALPAGSYVIRKRASQAYRGLIDTLLTPGERVIPPHVVGRVGLGFLSRLNNIQVPRFAAGGLVGGAAGGETVNINLQVGQRAIRLQGSRAQAQELATALRDLQRSL